MMRAPKSSTDSLSWNVSVSSSCLSEPALTFCTRSTPTLRRIIDSHATYGLFAMDPSISGGTALAITSNVMRSSV
jgi:hypothetical protein